jgi:uncharacterized surface protein with fasciclin (FAS1) repeats
MRRLRRAEPQRPGVGDRDGAGSGGRGGVQQSAADHPDLGGVGQAQPECELVETLNSSEYTVFAPTDAAFAKIDPATIDKLKTDSDLLTSILTYHVVPGQAIPAEVVGTHKTVQGADVTVTGAGNNLKVNDAGVVCGGVRTANAQVYLIDTVLMPPAN